MAKKLIFVSCGVFTDEEKVFGQQIAELIDQHDMESFVAPAVHQPADLNTHVFTQLQRCDGFVAVLHQRGEIHYKAFPVKYRASVWIQQEIGILFYRSFIVGRPIPMTVYMEKHILHEGLTAYSIINPIEFEQKESVLEHLSQWLKGPHFEEAPALALRESLFYRRAMSYDDHHWLLLELLAAHSREPGDVCLEHSIQKDFNNILGEKGMTPAQRGDAYSEARKKLFEDGMIAPTDILLAQTRYQALRLEKQWWNLVLEELKNCARIK